MGVGVKTWLEGEGVGGGGWGEGDSRQGPGRWEGQQFVWGLRARKKKGHN